MIWRVQTTSILGLFIDKASATPVPTIMLCPFLFPVIKNLHHATHPTSVFCEPTTKTKNSNSSSHPSTGTLAPPGFHPVVYTLSTTMNILYSSREFPTTYRLLSFRLIGEPNQIFHKAEALKWFFFPTHLFIFLLRSLVLRGNKTAFC